MPAEVRVRRVKDVMVKGKDTKRVEKDYTILLDKLEEGSASVSRSKSLQQGMSLEYGEYKISISDTATVSLPCESNLRSVRLANKIARQLRDEFVNEDFKLSAKLIRKLMRAHTEGQ